jgi:methionine synthase II (cobalamin-independent)
MIVKKIVWVTHLGWPIWGFDGEAWKPEKIMAFAINKVLPKVLREANASGAIIVQVKSPSLQKVQRNYAEILFDQGYEIHEAAQIAREKLSQQTHDQIAQVENSFESALQKALKERETVLGKKEVFVLNDCSNSLEAAQEFEAKLKERNCSLARKVKQVGLGAFRRRCATTFPTGFRTKRFKGTLRVPKRYTIGTKR